MVTMRMDYFKQDTMASFLSINSKMPSISSLSTSPPTSPSPYSLLHPINPAFDNSAPSGGILINKQRPSQPPSPADGFGPSFSRPSFSGPGSVEGSRTGIAAGLAHSVSSATSAVPQTVVPPSPLPTSPALTSAGSLPNTSGEQAPTPTAAARPPMAPRLPSSTKIRFAPLPEPKRQRSLSTGRNIQARSTLSSDGTRTAEWTAAIESEPPWLRAQKNRQPSDEEAVDDEEYDDEEVKRSWKNMGMGSWGKAGTYTKLLKPLRTPSYPEDTDAGRRGSVDSTRDLAPYTSGAPLKKSISTGGLIGSSPFRSSHEQERRRSLVGMGSGSSGRRQSKHARNGSMNADPDFSSLSASLGRSTESLASGASARPVKMLNGRVYGGKRNSGTASPAEPKFNEWNGMFGEKGSGGVGSVRAAGDREDEDDGSGVSWARKRREARERQRRESEAAMAQSAPATSSMLSPTDSTFTISSDASPLTSPTSAAPDATYHQLQATRLADEDHSPRSGTPTADHSVVAVKVPNNNSGQRWKGGEDEEWKESAVASDSSEEEAEDEEDNGDFESDDEADLLEEEENARTTSSAAGVEVISRHKD